MHNISSTYFIPRDGDKLSDLNKRVRIMPLYSYPHYKELNYRIKEHKNRYFIHIDFDSFYAQVEQRDQPHLRGKPVAVGGSSDGKGIVMTASHEARLLGVDGVMSIYEALQICPQLICIPCCGPKYEAILLNIQRMMKKYVPDECIEQYSIDECFVDVSQVVKSWDEANMLAVQIKNDILSEELLTTSMGLSYNKTYAKLTTKKKKNPGYYAMVRPETKEQLIYPMPVSKMWGIGRRIERRLLLYRIKTVGDLANASPAAMRKEFGINGYVLWRLARGEDTSEIFRKKEHEKSFNHHHTLSTPIWNKEDVLQEIRRIGEYVCRKMRAKRLAGKHLVLIIRYHNLTYDFGSTDLPEHTNDDRVVYDTAIKLLQRMRHPDERLKGRMFGMSILDLQTDLQRYNLSLYENRTFLPYYALDKLKEKYGDAVIRIGVGRK